MTNISGDFSAVSKVVVCLFRRESISMCRPGHQFGPAGQLVCKSEFAVPHSCRGLLSVCELSLLGSFTTCFTFQTDYTISSRGGERIPRKTYLQQSAALSYWNFSLLQVAENRIEKHTFHR
jgi:hypothetical protein